MTPAGSTFRNRFGLKGDVLRRKIRGRPVGSDIRPEEREIAGVPRPHPVVDFAAEFADRPRRDINKPDVLEVSIDEEDIGLADEHLGDFGPLPGVRFLGFGHDLLHPLLDGLGPVGERQTRLDGGQNVRRYVAEGLGDAGRHSFGLDFLGSRPGEESVCQVVALRGARRLDRAESHVVVGQEQAVGRDERARRADADDGEDQARPVGREDLLGRDRQTFRPKVELLKLADGIHALIARRAWERNQQTDKDKSQSRDPVFHISSRVGIMCWGQIST